MDIKERIQFTRRVLERNKSLIFPLSLVYLLVISAVYTYMYNGKPLVFYSSFPSWHTIPFSLLTILLSVLFGIMLLLFIEKIHELRLKSTGLGMAGMLFGGLAAGCPGCIFGLFPVVLGFFGVGGTLAMLPLNGIEFQLVAVVLMMLSIFTLARETDVSCKV